MDKPRHTSVALVVATALAALALMIALFINAWPRPKTTIIEDATFLRNGGCRHVRL